MNLFILLFILSPVLSSVNLPDADLLNVRDKCVAPWFGLWSSGGRLHALSIRCSTSVGAHSTGPGCWGSAHTSLHQQFKTMQWENDTFYRLLVISVYFTLCKGTLSCWNTVGLGLLVPVKRSLRQPLQLFIVYLQPCGNSLRKDHIWVWKSGVHILLVIQCISCYIHIVFIKTVCIMTAISI